MAASTEPRSGLFYGWSLGENGWNTGMDANLLRRLALGPAMQRMLWYGTAPHGSSERPARAGLPTLKTKPSYAPSGRAHGLQASPCSLGGPLAKRSPDAKAPGLFH